MSFGDRMDNLLMKGQDFTKLRKIATFHAHSDFITKFSGIVHTCYFDGWPADGGSGVR